MDDLLVAARVPEGRRPFDEVVPDGEDQVGLGQLLEDGEVRLGPLQPHGGQRQRLPVVHGPLAHEGMGHRDAELADEGPQRVGGAVAGRLTAHHAVAGQHERISRLRQPRGRPLERRFPRPRIRRPADGHRRQPGRHGHSRHVLRQLEMHRPRFLETRQPEGPPHHLRKRFRTLDARVPFRDRRQHPHDVDVLVAFLVDALEAGLAGNSHQRGAVELRIGDAGDEIGRPGAERGETDPGIAAETPVHVRHEGGALLVAGTHEADAGARSERVENVEDLLARHAEDVLDALVLEALDEQAGRAERQRAHGPAWTCTSAIPAPA